MNGFLLVDKPEGLTSHAVVAQVRRITGMRRVGHTGTLDPMATGVLPIAVGNATRMTEYMLADDKIYTGSFLPGFVSDTYDATGQMHPQSAPDFTTEDLQALFSSMEGEQEQLPPMYSAKKVGGRKLYELARKGETVERKPARIRIHELRLLAREAEEVSFYAYVSKGTYIRTLVHDIGQALSCGAVLTSLRRIASGACTIRDCRPLDHLSQLQKETLEALLLPADTAIAYAPSLEVSAGQGVRLCQGQRLSVQQEPQALLRVYAKGRFLGPGRITGRELKLIKVLE